MGLRSWYKIDIMNWYKKAQKDYRDEHTAPSKNSGAPLYDLTGIYPEDIYSNKATLYYSHYGHNDPRDYPAISIIQSLRNKPNGTVRIYRAVPSILTTQDKILDLENQKRYILKNGKLPPNISNRSDYYGYISEELDKLRSLPVKNEPKLSINAGDWVTIDREYAKEHGESQLNGNYKIISKVVSAKDIYTDGDSIYEWGYDPS